MGPGHPLTFGVMACLADEYYDHGRWLETEALEVRVLEGCKKELGRTDIDTLEAMQ